MKRRIFEKYNWLWTTVLILVGSIFTTYCIQYLLLEKELRDRISDKNFLLNICCCLLIYLLTQACTNRIGLTFGIVHGSLILFALVNDMVYQFRGNEIIFGDVKSLLTGMSVVSNYKVSITSRMMLTLFISLLCCILLGRLKLQCKNAWMMRMVCLSAAIFLVLFVTEETKSTATETWEQKGSYRNGFLLNFGLSVRDSFVEKPKSYTKEVIAQIEDEYIKEDGKQTGKKPTMIAIMNESFADFRVLGELQTNQAVMPFIDSLKENTIKGYAISSVYGAKTPNSEWEFLTGNSMAYLPAGSVPYQQYLNEKNAYSIVDTLKEQDYTCVAMHPYYETGWSRNVVYPKMGFDEMYFLEDFDQNNLMREYVSDATMYDEIIKRYEEGVGTENLFLMGITMQNHGGYKAVYDNFEGEVYGTNIRYFDVNQYLSLAHQTDLATKELIEYFSAVEEPVVICFFGDHQPNLNRNFYRNMNGKGLSGLSLDELEELFTVPFFIWTNYESESMMVERTSLNFLSTLLLERAGIQLPPYQSFLKDFMEVIPAMNARGFYSYDKGRYIHYGKGSLEEEEWLEKYRILQYNGLFDNKNRSKTFFFRGK